MYDLKEEILDDENNLTDDEGLNRVHDRSYYKPHLTDSILTTKLSHIPTDSLF